METKIAIFRGKKIRKTLYQNEWWFVINDVIESLTDSNDPAQYFKRLKQRDQELEKLTTKGGVQIVPPLMLEVETTGGKQKMYCWNTEGIFRLVQSIPSPKAEPMKRWLARVGYERVKEIEDPELATKRTRMLYKLKGYSVFLLSFPTDRESSKSLWSLLIPTTSMYWPANATERCISE